jgi:hypothetical protein
LEEKLARKNRVARTKSDLKQELEDQLDILRMSCTAYDSGTEAAGKSIGGSLRLLLYSHRQSRGLLDQLGYRSDRFISTATERKKNEIGPFVPLLIMNVMPDQVRWKPRLGMDPQCKESRKLTFVDWWSEIVVIDTKHVRFSRMDLVMHVADTDGGAHVDPGLEESYMDLSRANSLGYEFGENTTPFLGRPVLACLRQIAQEVIATLAANVPDLGSHVAPIVPPEDEFPVGEGQLITLKGGVPDEYKGIDGLMTTFSLNRMERLK